MLVSELIENTEWHPPRGKSARPTVTVILPTFRRGQSGLFKKAVLSVLNQQDCSLELLIVDDCSTDGTIEQIRNFYTADPRVGYLRHPCNIGLPAISEYEAYRRARGEYISFAFDDTSFRLKGLHGLLSFIQSQGVLCCYGEVKTFFPRGPNDALQSQVLGVFSKKNNLLSTNCIANNGVLVHRKVLEDIGLYDPSPVIARLCDWDLWCRIRPKYTMLPFSNIVGEEYGPARSDSLGATYGMEGWSIAEWMNLGRNENLQPKNFEAIDVLDIPSCMSRDSAFLMSVINETYAIKWEESGLHKAVSSNWNHNTTFSDYSIKKSRLLICSQKQPAWLHQCFFSGKEDTRWMVRTVSPAHWKPIEMVRATALIVTEPDSKKTSSWIQTANKLGVPVYGLFFDKNEQRSIRTPQKHADEHYIELLGENPEGFQRLAFPVQKNTRGLNETDPWATDITDSISKDICEQQKSTIAKIAQRHIPPTPLEVDNRWRNIAAMTKSSKFRKQLKHLEHLLIRPIKNHLKSICNKLIICRQRKTEN